MAGPSTSEIRRRFSPIPRKNGPSQRHSYAENGNRRRAELVTGLGNNCEVVAGLVWSKKLIPTPAESAEIKSAMTEFIGPIRQEVDYQTLPKYRQRAPRLMRDLVLAAAQPLDILHRSSPQNPHLLNFWQVLDKFFDQPPPPTTNWDRPDMSLMALYDNLPIVGGRVSDDAFYLVEASLTIGKLLTNPASPLRGYFHRNIIASNGDGVPATSIDGVVIQKKSNRPNTLSLKCFAGIVDYDAVELKAGLRQELALHEALKRPRKEHLDQLYATLAVAAIGWAKSQPAQFHFPDNYHLLVFRGYYDLAKFTYPVNETFFASWAAGLLVNPWFDQQEPQNQVLLEQITCAKDGHPMPPL